MTITCSIQTGKETQFSVYHKYCVNVSGLHTVSFVFRISFVPCLRSIHIIHRPSCRILQRRRRGIRVEFFFANSQMCIASRHVRSESKRKIKNFLRQPMNPSESHETISAIRTPSDMCCLRAKRSEIRESLNYPEGSNRRETRDLRKDQRSYISQPSKWLLTRLDRWLDLLLGLEFWDSTSANSVRSSSSSHNSSSSSASSAGLSNPLTFDKRSRSAALASLSCCSFSSAYNSVLSPANSFN